MAAPRTDNGACIVIGVWVSSLCSLGVWLGFGWGSCSACFWLPGACLAGCSVASSRFGGPWLGLATVLVWGWCLVCIAVGALARGLMFVYHWIIQC